MLYKPFLILFVTKIIPYEYSGQVLYRIIILLYLLLWVISLEVKNTWCTFSRSWCGGRGPVVRIVLNIALVGSTKDTFLVWRHILEILRSRKRNCHSLRTPSIIYH